MKKYLFGLIAVILISGLIFSGCAKQAPAPAPTPTKAPAPAPTGPQQGGILKIIASPGLTNIGYPGKPYVSGNPGFARCAVEFLLNFDSKGTANVVPELATTWKYSPDYKSLIFTLRKGVKFHDGTDFNAEAAKYNLDLHRSGFRSELRSITSIDIVDDYTIRLNLSSYDSVLLVALGGMAGWIVSPTALKTMGDEAMLHPVGTGPFKFVSYQKDVSLKFEKFNGYWQKGKPYLDGIEFVFIKDPVTALLSFKAGEAQFIRSVSARDASELQSKGNFTVAKYPTVAAGMAGDSAHPDSPFADIKVRRAIAHAIDNAAIAKAVGAGFYEATNQFASRGAWGAVYNPAVAGYPYNPDKAKQLLTQANYPNGFSTTLTYTSTNADQAAMFASVQAYLSAVGINTKLDPADPARFTKLTVEGWKNQLVFFRTACAGGLNPAQAYRSSLNSKASSWDPKSIWIPEDYDAKYWQMAAEPDPEKVRVMSQALSKIVTDDYCLAFPIYIEHGIFAYSPNVRDMDMYRYATSEWLPENAWLSK